MKRKCKQWW